MELDGWTRIFSALTLFVSSISQFEAQSCGETSNTTDGFFTSPSYPNVYNISTECTYTISLPTNASITIYFETFELDRSDNDNVTISCASNSSYELQTYRWDSEILPISLPWCSYGRIHFVSDKFHDYSTRGFKVHYQANTIGCGSTVFSASPGTISSPNFPQNYNNDENCTYSIWAAETSSFTLTFESFRLEPDCQRDWVQIRCDNSSYISPKYCGSTLPRPAYISNCSKVLLWFHTDGNTVSSGFRLQYSFTRDGCGKRIYSGLSGVITSPNYPKGYSSYVYFWCYYDVYTVGSIAFDFQSFDLEYIIDHFDGDDVRIECATDSDYSDIMYYYGKSLPPLISFPSCRMVRIIFSSQPAISGTGFSVRYQINPLVAHGNITNSPKNFTADVGSRVHLNCTTTAEGYLPSWTLNKDGTNEDFTVIAYFCDVQSDYIYDYAVESGGPGVCNLMIPRVTLAEAGVYTCIDASLASASSVVTVVVPASTSKPTSDQGPSDSEVIIIVLAVLLTICLLGYIIIAARYTMRKYRNKSGEEDTRATGSAHRDHPILSIRQSLPSRQPEEQARAGMNQHLNHGHDNPPPAYDNL